MRWKQFFTPAESFDADQARAFISSKKTDDINVLDVRQPSEYETGHIPGAKLIPLPDLTARIAELDPAKPTVIY